MLDQSKITPGDTVYLVNTHFINKCVINRVTKVLIFLRTNNAPEFSLRKSYFDLYNTEYEALENVIANLKTSIRTSRDETLRLEQELKFNEKKLKESRPAHA